MSEHALRDERPAALVAPARTRRSSRESIRAVERTLRMLSALAANESNSVSELAAAAQVPRTTAFRLLSSLARDGYAVRCADSRYTAGAALLKLAAGMVNGVSLAGFARPYADRLSAAVGWPVSIESVRGIEVWTHYATDRYFGLRIVRARAGQRAPLLQRATGLLHLGLMEESLRAALLERLNVPRARCRALEAELAGVQERRVATIRIATAHGTRVAHAVPLYGTSGEMEAALVLRLPEAREERADAGELLTALCRAGGHCQRDYDAGRRARAAG